ncbi:MAG: monovalent cation/H(+) antiporter subunit G [Pseudomonadota bacterium]
MIGALFIALGGLGLLRMPDVYNRIHAGTKAVTLGSISVLLGIAFLYPQWWPKLVVIGGFLLFTNPVAASIIARAARIRGIRPWRVEEPGGEE